jgi:hypothetical protein
MGRSLLGNPALGAYRTDRGKEPSYRAQPIGSPSLLLLRWSGVEGHIEPSGRRFTALNAPSYLQSCAQSQMT